MKKFNRLTKEGRWVLSQIEGEILEVANCYNEVTTSDLQGIASATARRIIDMVLENRGELEE